MMRFFFLIRILIAGLRFRRALIYRPAAGPETARYTLPTSSQDAPGRLQTSLAQERVIPGRYVGFMPRFLTVEAWDYAIRAPHSSYWHLLLRDRQGAGSYASSLETINIFDSSFSDPTSLSENCVNSVV